MLLNCACDASSVKSPVSLSNSPSSSSSIVGDEKVVELRERESVCVCRDARKRDSGNWDMKERGKGEDGR